MPSPILHLAAGANFPFLADLLWLSAVVLLTAIVCDRLRIPTIVGYLGTGVLAGPHAFGLVREQHVVDAIAEVGVIFLLFTIGVEFSLRSFASMKQVIIGGGLLQWLLTAGACVPIHMIVFAGSLREALFFGLLIFLSSTAIGIKLLQQRGEAETPHGRIAVGICIFQDLLIVPLMLAVPLLAGKSSGVTAAGALLLVGKGLAVVALVIVGARFLAPWTLFKVARIRDREVFLLAVVCVVLATAWLTAWVGLSLALGAFLAGVLLSESEWGDRALGSILPFRDVFLSIFFISVGMLLDVRAIIHSPLLVAGLAIAVLLTKVLAATAAVMFLRYPARVALQAALVISQVGEFSFVLSRAGLQHGLISEANYQLFLAVSILSMIATPGMIALGPLLARRLQAQLPSTAVDVGEPLQAGELEKLSGHLIIVGFGPTGRYVARAARAAGIPWAVIEMNPQTVRAERALGEPIVYGDASEEAVLHRVGIDRARALLVVIADTGASRRVANMASALNPAMHVIVRTRFITEIEPLLAAGADEVVPEELETAVEILGRVLQVYLLGPERIDAFARELRADGYSLLRHSGQPATERRRDILADMPISRLRIEPGFNMGGKTIAELALRQRHGITVLAVRRAGAMFVNPAGDLRLEVGDELIVLEGEDRLSGVVRRFSG